MKNLKFSVAMAVYRGDNAAYFKEAVHSIYTTQIVKPDEIIVVVDGSVPNEIEQTFAELEHIVPLRIVRFSENRGHASARQAGLDAATNEWVAIMDADDLAEPIRFEAQINAIEANTAVSVVGGQITEFVGSPENIVGERLVPLDDREIKQYLMSRCPMNLVTVMYRKSDVLAAGGFMDWYCEEDYYLWIRLAEKGYKFLNLPDVLVNVRVGADMYRRRGGWRYFRSEAKLQGYMLRHGIISLPRYSYNVAGRFAVQVAMPNRLRGFVFQKLFRK